MGLSSLQTVSYEIEAKNGISNGQSSFQWPRRAIAAFREDICQYDAEAS